MEIPWNSHWQGLLPCSIALEDEGTFMIIHVQFASSYYKYIIVYCTIFRYMVKKKNVSCTPSGALTHGISHFRTAQYLLKSLKCLYGRFWHGEHENVRCTPSGALQYEQNHDIHYLPPQGCTAALPNSIATSPLRPFVLRCLASVPPAQECIRTMPKDMPTCTIRHHLDLRYLQDSTRKMSLRNILPHVVCHMLRRPSSLSILSLQRHQEVWHRQLQPYANDSGSHCQWNIASFFYIYFIFFSNVWLIKLTESAGNIYLHLSSLCILCAGWLSSENVSCASSGTRQMETLDGLTHLNRNITATMKKKQLGKCKLYISGVRKAWKFPKVQKADIGWCHTAPQKMDNAKLGVWYGTYGTYNTELETNSKNLLKQFKSYWTHNQSHNPILIWGPHGEIHKTRHRIILQRSHWILCWCSRKFSECNGRWTLLAGCAGKNIM